MDLKSLSLFMQTSVTYECTVCKLYFGTEDQLIAHHKGSHSKRLKVSLNPELRLEEDDEYVSIQEDTTPKDNAKCTDSSHGPEENSIAKLQNNEASNTTSSTEGTIVPSTDSNENPKDAQSFKQPLANATPMFKIEEDELPFKRAKTATKSTSTNSNTNQIQAGGLENKNSKCSQTKNPTHDRQYSESMKDTIESGHYGYISDSGFHRFSLEELKKFAVQVVALFKLDESHHDFSQRTANDGVKFGSQALPIPVIQNDITAASMSLLASQQDHLPGSSHSASGSNSASSSNNAMDDPNKSCYKCGESGHFAWGCTNPRNREIQPKRKRQRRGRKKEQSNAEMTTG